MKDRKLFFALIGASVVAVLVVLISTLWLGSKSSDGSIMVNAAIENMEPGKKILATDLKQVQIQADKLPAGVIIDFGQLINRTVKTKINAGDVLVESMLFTNSLGGNLASDIPVGKRAFTISVNEISSVGGFASPGSFVDVILSGKDIYNQPYSKVIVQHAKILAISQLRSEDGNPKIGSSATLEVTPQEVQQLDVARTLGSLALVLRNIADNSTNTGNPSASRNDLNLPGQGQVEIIRGPMTSDAGNPGSRQ